MTTVRPIFGRFWQQKNGAANSTRLVKQTAQGLDEETREAMKRKADEFKPHRVALSVPQDNDDPDAE
jgi:hypothetical protein